MGSLRVSCRSGCACAATTINGLAQERVSRHRLACIPVSAARECVVAMAVERNKYCPNDCETRLGCQLAGAAACKTKAVGEKFVLHALRVLLSPPMSMHCAPPEGREDAGGGA